MGPKVQELDMICPIAIDPEGINLWIFFQVKNKHNPSSFQNMEDQKVFKKWELGG